MPLFVARLMISVLLLLLWAKGSTAATEPQSGFESASRQVSIKPAIDGIFEAFVSHPLVGLGEAHGVSQIIDFYRQIVRDPRFASEVGNVVVEFGGAAHQHVIDHYINGDQVSYAELRKVWTETVGWQPTVPSEGYALFFAQVRQTNLSLPRNGRIKVWLGEPPIDWSKINTTEDYLPVSATRDSYPAELIVRQILKRGKKALVIYGGAHFDVTQSWENELRAVIAKYDQSRAMSQGTDATLRDLVEQQYPGAFFVAQPYRGFENEECTKRFEQRMNGWSLPTLAVSVRDTALERDIRACLKPRSLRRPLPPSIPADVQERIRAIIALNVERDRPLLSDSILFYAPSAELTRASPFIEFALDENWRAELSRRNEIITGRRLQPEWGRSIPLGPVTYTGRD